MADIHLSDAKVIIMEAQNGTTDYTPIPAVPTSQARDVHAIVADHVRKTLNDQTRAQIVDLAQSVMAEVIEAEIADVVEKHFEAMYEAVIAQVIQRQLVMAVSKRSNAVIQEMTRAQ